MFRILSLMGMGAFCSFMISTRRSGLHMKYTTAAPTKGAAASQPLTASSPDRLFIARAQLSARDSGDEGATGSQRLGPDLFSDGQMGDLNYTCVGYEVHHDGG